MNGILLVRAHPEATTTAHHIPRRPAFTCSRVFYVKVGQVVQHVHSSKYLTANLPRQSLTSPYLTCTQDVLSNAPRSLLTEVVRS